MTERAFDRYQIIRPLGMGGMADVYLAHDPVLGRDVAVKAPKVAHLSGAVLARFEVEARAVARLEHPAIVPLYEYGQSGGRPYLVMRHMRGGSLAGRIARGSMPLHDTLAVLERIAAALDYAHAHGVIHRDVKPGNILFDDNGHAFLSDFGIARLENSGPRLTATGTAPGTLAYASPEQATGRQDLDGRSDIYSLGVVVYEMLTGELPYKAVSGLQQAMQHVNAPIPNIRARRPDLPPATQGVIERVLAKDPNARYARAVDFMVDLGRLAGRRATPAGARPQKAGAFPWLLAVAGLALVIFFAAFLLSRPGPNNQPQASATTENALTGAAPLGVPTSIGSTTGEAAGSDPTSTPFGPVETSPAAEPSATSLIQIATNGDAPATFTLGETAIGSPIEVYRFGDGPQKLVFVGGLTGGYAPATETLMRQAIEHFTYEPQLIPEEITAYFIPVASPDTPYAPGEFRGRLNANGVDINRNWDCQWTADPLWQGQQRRGAGGTAPFSESESRLLRDFILSENPAAVVAWHARASVGLITPGGCGVVVEVSEPLAELFGAAAGYIVQDYSGQSSAVLNGDATNWLDANGIPAISVLLTSFSTVDWPNNLAGMMAVMTEYAGRPALPRPIPTTAPPPTPTTATANCQVAPASRWEGFWNANRDRLGCANGGERSVNAAFQYFERGTAIWREDVDRIYVLYYNGVFAIYRDDEGPEGYYQSELLKGGFGYLWNNNATVRNGLGQPLAAEQVAGGFAVQDFAGGVLFTFNDNGVQEFALFFDNGVWLSP